MKKLLVMGFLALAFGLPASADLKIAMVDSDKVFDAYYKTKDLATQIAAKKDKFEKDILDLQAEYQNASRRPTPCRPRQKTSPSPRCG